MDHDYASTDSIQDESMSSAKQMELSSEMCVAGQDVERMEVSTLHTYTPDDVTNYDESQSTHMPQIPEKGLEVPANFVTQQKPSKLSAFESFVENQKDDDRDKCFVKPAKESVPTTFQHIPKASISKAQDSLEDKDVSERNLEKYSKAAESWMNIRSQMKIKFSEKVIKSDSEVTKIIDYYGNISNISSALSKIKLETSSAPSTFSDEKENRKNVLNIKNSNLFAKSKNNDSSKSILESSKIILKPPKSLCQNKSDHSQNQSSEMLEEPISKCSKTTNITSEIRKDLTETSRVEGKIGTPAAKRPTDFNVKMRKSFYIFAPRTSAGILRQCQSLPEIRWARQREEISRRSMNLEQHFGTGRNFSSEAGQSSLETGVSTVIVDGIKLKISTSTEALKYSKKTISNPRILDSSTVKLRQKAKVCSKLTSVSLYDTTQKAKYSEETEGFLKESPQKRKEITPMKAECSFTNVKKVRISPKLNIEVDKTDTTMENAFSVSEKEPMFLQSDEASPLTQKGEGSPDSEFHNS